MALRKYLLELQKSLIKWDEDGFNVYVMLVPYPKTYTKEKAREILSLVLADGGQTWDEMETDYLFARPSFIEGVGRLVDLGNSLNTYNYSHNEAEADARAIRSDWRAIGNDLYAALEQLRSETRR